MGMLDGQVAVVTGAAQGIGLAIAGALAREGADLALADMNEGKLREAAAPLTASGRTVTTGVVNVADRDQVEGFLEEALARHGHVDILVNNAGITRDNLVMRMKDEEWDSVIAVNLKGAFLCSRAVSRHMLKQRKGRIVNIASVVGLMGNAGQANYAASKAGLIGMTKSLAKEFASRGITVNAVAPGFIATAMTAILPEEVKAKMLAATPLARFGEPQDVAQAVLFFASPMASYVTGQVLAVDGGLAM